MGTSKDRINFHSLPLQLQILVLDSALVCSLSTINGPKMILYICSYSDRRFPFWSIYIIQSTNIMGVMEVNYESAHIMSELLECFLVGFKIYIAIHLIGRST